MASEKEFISLLNQHQKIVYKVCNLYMDAHSDREDLFQEITYRRGKRMGISGAMQNSLPGYIVWR
jgi:DNA-directed RNA polymerase specialized sigma24 family protein